MKEYSCPICQSKLIKVSPTLNQRCVSTNAASMNNFHYFFLAINSYSQEPQYQALTMDNFEITSYYENNVYELKSETKLFAKLQLLSSKPFVDLLSNPEQIPLLLKYAKKLAILL